MFPRLFYTEGSPYARICRMAIREKGIQENITELTTTLRDSNAAVLNFSSVGRVPALVLPNNITISETVLILSWMDRFYNIDSIFPTDPFSLSSYGLAIGLLDGITVWNRELRRRESIRSQSIINFENVRANRIADAIERIINSGAFSNIDSGFLTLASALGYAENRLSFWDWRQNRPLLERWFKQASQRPAYFDTKPKEFFS